MPVHGVGSICELHVEDEKHKYSVACRERAMLLLLETESNGVQGKGILWT